MNLISPEHLGALPENIDLAQTVAVVGDHPPIHVTQHIEGARVENPALPLGALSALAIWFAFYCYRMNKLNG